MEKKYEFDITSTPYIEIHEYTSFFGEAENGTEYPYLEIEKIDGYKCGRCSGPCNEDRDDEYKLILYVWEPEK